MNPYDGLSEEVKVLVEKKAAIWNLEPSRALEWMILEFSETPPEERIRWIIDRDKAKIAFLEGNPDASVAKAWMDGYKVGWLQFQTRKPSHPFRRKE